MKYKFMTGLLAAVLAMTATVQVSAAPAAAQVKKPNLPREEFLKKAQAAQQLATTAQIIDALKAILEKEQLGPNEQTDAIRTMFKLTKNDPAMRQKIYDYLKATRTQGKPGQMYHYYIIARGQGGNVSWFQRSYWEPGTYERWRECTDLILKDIEPIEKKDSYANFYKDNAYIAYAYGDFAFARAQLDKAMSFGYRTQFADTAALLYLYSKDHAALANLVKEERKAKNYDYTNDLFWCMLEYFDKGGKAKDLDKKFSIPQPADVKFIPYAFSDTWTVFAPGKALDNKVLNDFNRLNAIPAELDGIKAQQMQAVNGLVTLPKAEAKTPALLMQEFEAAEDGMMQIGCGGDQYYRLNVNGKDVINRLWAGNGTDKVATSNFTVTFPVKKGKNIVKVQLLAGKEGFSFISGKANPQFTSKDKMLKMRSVSEICFRAKRYDICRDIYNYILGDMFVSLKPLVYNVKFDADAPRTADGFTYSKYYNDWANMVTCFRPYGDCPNINNETDAKRFLKDAEKPQVPEDWKTGIYALWNTEGLHIYVRCNDPEAADILNGKRDGGTLECTFRPAEEAPYNMFFFDSLPSASDHVNIDFASPSARYSLTNDVIFRDAVANKDGVTAHIFIPWAGFCNDLPVNGKVWYFGMQRWCKGGGFSISGQVHELGRMLNLKMDISPAQLKELKRGVCIAAFNRYTNFINTIEFKSWQNDRDLGDPAFYESELAPLVKELSEAGEKLTAPDADVDALFETYVKQWSSFSYIVAAKRKDYLKRTMFE